MRLVGVLMLAAACTEPNPLIAESPHRADMSPEIIDACELARTRCSRCHTLDRIIHTKIVRPNEWPGYVHRMRLMPGSAIRADAEPAIVRCFVFRQETP